MPPKVIRSPVKTRSGSQSDEPEDIEITSPASMSQENFFQYILNNYHTSITCFKYQSLLFNSATMKHWSYLLKPWIFQPNSGQHNPLVTYEWILCWSILVFQSYFSHLSIINYLLIVAFLCSVFFSQNKLENAPFRVYSHFEFVE